jgi:hypothetical protein
MSTALPETMGGAATAQRRLGLALVGLATGQLMVVLDAMTVTGALRDSPPVLRALRYRRR